MQMIEAFQVSAPATESQIAGSDDEMSIALICQEQNLRVKASRVNCNRLDFVHAARVLGPVLI